MQPTRGLGSAPLPPANRGCALLFGLAPGRVCRVSLRPRRAGIVTVALVLASRRTGVTRYPALWSSDFPHARRLPGDARPSGRLAGRGVLRPRRARRSRGWSEAGAAPRRRALRLRRRTTRAGPPAGRGRSPRSRGGPRSSSGHAARASRTSAGTRPASPATSAHSGCSFASLTRQRPWSCSTISFESRNMSTFCAPRARWASASARTTPVYSATLFVWTPEGLGDRGVGPGASGPARRRASRRSAPRPATRARDCRGPRRRSG